MRLTGKVHKEIFYVFFLGLILMEVQRSEIHLTSARSLHKLLNLLLLILFFFFFLGSGRGVGCHDYSYVSLDWCSTDLWG